MSYSSIGTSSSNNNGMKGEVMAKLNRFVLTNKKKKNVRFTTFSQQIIGGKLLLDYDFTTTLL